MYQAISTKFVGPTNHRGPRVIARAEAGKVTVAWDHSLGVEGNHVAAAKALAEKLGWQGSWYGGSLDNCYVFVSTRRTDGSAEGAAFEVGE